MHRVTGVDPEALTGVCSECGPVGVRRKSGSKPGRWRWQCRTARTIDRQRYPSPPRTSYRVHLGPVCVRCGFVPEHPCQLQIDHILPRWTGGTHEPINLQTLCANCHCLKSRQDEIDYRAARNPTP